MKNRQKSRSGCRTCKLRRLRCDETKPGCRNCAQKGFDCPGYQQRLQWSTKHERSISETKATAPINFTQLVSAASESIVQVQPETQKSPPDRVTAKPKSESKAKPKPKDPAPAPALSPVAASPASSYGTTNGSINGSSTDSDALRDPTAYTFTPPSSLSSQSPRSEGHATLVPWTRDGSLTPPGQAQWGALNLPFWQPVVHIPSFLIDHWFKSVCGSWSAFDSPTNPYRQLTSVLCTKSKPVFLALQAISAASLVERLPHVLRETARTAPRMATEAIKSELVAFYNGPRTRFPAELLLSLFCLSSSMCWMEARELGLPYVRQARAVFESLDRRHYTDREKELLDFFNGCLVYEEMLRSVVSDDDQDFKNMLSWPEPSIGPLLAATPHAWTGVSQAVLRLFGKAMALCRKSRSRWRQNDGTSYRILQGAMKDIEEARVVEEALLAIDIQDHDEMGQVTDQTRQLHDASEAYRLSSLLQLYETFPDLIAKRIPDLAEADGPASWEAWVAPLALHVTNTLERIPSGSLRCIQPLLCLCAGTGLRFDSKVPLATGAYNYLLKEEPGVSLSTPGTPDLALGSLDGVISEAAIKTSRARHFIMDRLDRLELTLPPKPIGVAKQLLRAVWSAYDSEIGTQRRTHWLDVMSSTGLHSLFG